MRYIFLSILLLTTAAETTFAQNNTSPYSILGIGDIETSAFDKSAGMANSGLALASDRYLYQENPASYAWLGDHFFNMEVSMRYKGVAYYGTPAQNSSTGSSDLQVRKLAMAIKVKPFWGVSLGLMPFSTSSYSFFANKSVEGTIFLNQTYYQGSGGLNQYYIANSFKLGKHLSLGIQTSYLAGSFMQTESLDSITLGTSLNTTRNIYMSNLYVKGGLLYQTQVSKKWKLGLAANGSPKTSLNNTYYLTVVSQGITLVNNQPVPSSYFTTPVLPLMAGGGISLTRNNSLTFTGDYQFQNWGALGYNGLGYALVNSNRVSAGVQYAKIVNYTNGFVEKSNLQAGFYYGNSYVNINGYQVRDYGITLGIGGSNKAGFLGYQAYLQLGQTGTSKNQLVKEEYIQIGFNFSFREVWYTKVKRFY